MLIGSIAEVKKFVIKYVHLFFLTWSLGYNSLFCWNLPENILLDWTWQIKGFLTTIIWILVVWDKSVGLKLSLITRQPFLSSLPGNN